MIKHSIYIDSDLHKELTRTSKQLGMSLNDVIRSRLSQDFVSSEVQKMTQKVDAIFALLDAVVGDIGFVVGATRAGCKTSEKHAREGEFYEASFKRIANVLKPIFGIKHTQEKDG